MRYMASDNNSLYVRLEEEEEIHQGLEDIEKIVKNIEELSALIKQTDQIKRESVQNVKQNVSKLDEKIQLVNSALPGDNSISVPDVQQEQEEKKEQFSNKEDEEIDDSVGELHSELENLQDELSKIN